MTTNDGDRGDLLTRLAKLNPTAVVLGALGLFLVVLFLPDLIGGVLILLIAAALVALLTRTWPVLPTAERVMRLVVIALLVAVAVAKVL